MSAYKRSPAPFVPPIPPDVTSSSESSPVMQSHGGFPQEQPMSALGRPGMSHQTGLGVPGTPHQTMGYPGGYPQGPYTDYSEFKEWQDYQQEASLNAAPGMGMMQRWQQSRKPSAQNVAQLRSPGPTRGEIPGAPTRGGYYGAPPPFGYAPAPPPVGYGYSPYPQTPYQYGAQFPFGGGPPAMYAGGGGGAAPYGMGGMASPYMTPLPTPGLLDPMPGMPGAAPPMGGRPGGSTIGRPGQQTVDMCVGKWLPGPDYAPVLDHLSYNIVKPPHLDVHPLLRPISESRDSADPFLVFDILFPTNSVHVSNEPARKSWSKGRKDPATFPRLKVIRLVNKFTPWVIQVTSDSASGITVADVVNAIHEHFRVNASEDDDWNSVEPATQSEILMAYKWNRSTEVGAPGGTMPDALLRGDFLIERTMFAGLKPADGELLKERMDVKNFPATFELLLHTR